MRIVWTDDKKKWLKECCNEGLCTYTITDMFNEKYNASAKRSAIRSSIKRFGFKSGYVSRVPGNKGVPWSVYMPKESQEKCKKGWFKKGQVPHNVLKNGEERKDDKGGVMLKIGGSDCVSKRMELSRPGWERKHEYMYRQYHNLKELPKGSIVFFANNDKSDFSKENLILISRPILCKMVMSGLIDKTGNVDMTLCGIDIAKIELALQRLERNN